MALRLRNCCCCFSLRAGIYILGIFETFLLVLFILAVAFASVKFGLYKNYNIVPYYVTPVVAYLPLVVTFYILLCQKFNLASRKLY